jgi:2-oxoglutarate dehydrogenase complex dehydrogenase (E1) component-like enzyme
MIAEIDPLGMPRPCPPELQPSFYGLTEDDFERRFSCETVHPAGPLTLREIIGRLRNTYCRSIGVEYMHIHDLSVRRWLQRRMEPVENRTELSREEQIRILTRLTDAVTITRALFDDAKNTLTIQASSSDAVSTSCAGMSCEMSTSVASGHSPSTTAFIVPA